MTINRDIKSIYSNDDTIKDILLSILSQNTDYTAFFQKTVNSISIQEELLNNE